MRSERIALLLSDPVWSGPIWILDLVQLKRDKDGSVDGAREDMRRDLKAKQLRATQSASSDSGKMDWFRSARLVSLNSVSLFPDTHGAWDCVLLFEFSSPEAFVRAASSEDEDRIVASVATMRLAVKPAFLAHEAGVFPPGEMERAAAYSDAFWHQDLARKEREAFQRLDEPQVIFPDASAFKFMASPPIPTNGPLFALNFLRFRRRDMESSAVFDGRLLYHRYGRKVTSLIEEKMPKPSGGRLSFTPCLTLTGPIEWDEVR
jgi:hypothetical protein